MDRRSFTGLIVFVLGIVLAFFSWPTGIIFGVIGLAIILNQNEDKIEKIKFNKK